MSFSRGGFMILLTLLFAPHPRAKILAKTHGGVQLNLRFRPRFFSLHMARRTVFAPHRLSADMSAGRLRLPVGMRMARGPQLTNPAGRP
jgi:hypothetical protein